MRRTDREERRRYLRVPVWAELKFVEKAPPYEPMNRVCVEFPEHRPMEETSIFMRGRARNISAGGLLFETPVEVRLGSLIQIAIAMTPGDPPVKLQGEVVRVTPVEEEEGGYRVAVNFVASDDRETARITGFVERYYA